MYSVAVVGVKAPYEEGEGLEEGFEERKQKVFRDALEAAEEPELGDLVDQVDVIQALNAVQIALVDGIDAQEAGAPGGLGLAPLADGDLDRMGLLDATAHAPIGPRVSEVVEVAIGEDGQALVAGVAEHPVGALTELAGGRTRKGGVQGVDLGQQADIGLEIAPGKGLGRGATAVGDVTPLAELGDEAGDPGAREAGDLAQVAP